ncbi:hypothetical protein JOF40_000179 [Aeromicrobium fastidiosum]|nr:hypothetical protein [Aeromicrobium fastidiosum]
MPTTLEGRTAVVADVDVEGGRAAAGRPSSGVTTSPGRRP